MKVLVLALLLALALAQDQSSGGSPGSSNAAGSAASSGSSGSNSNAGASGSSSSNSNAGTSGSSGSSSNQGSSSPGSSSSNAGAGSSGGSAQGTSTQATTAAYTGTPPNIQYVKSGPCQVDLMFNIDTSTSVTIEFSKQREFAFQVIRYIPPEDFANRIRVGIVTFNGEAQLIMPLGSVTNKDQIMAKIQSIEHVGGITSAVSGENIVLSELAKSHRQNTKIVVIHISDGNSFDPFPILRETARKVIATGAEVFAVTYSENSRDYYKPELIIWAGSERRVYTEDRLKDFTNDVLQFANDPSCTKAEPPPNPKLDPCQVDLIITMDVSGSVEDEFIQERNFVVGTLQHSPDEDYRSRIQVGLIKFARNAELILPLGLRAKNESLGPASEIKFIGGETSALSGLNMALDQFKQHGRANAFPYIIHISDGNSGPWDTYTLVRQMADRLYDAYVRVFSITYSPDYYLPELAAYSGSPRRVYTQARLQDFVNDIVARAEAPGCSNGVTQAITVPTIRPFKK